MFRSNRIPIVFLIVLVLTACIRTPPLTIAPALPRPHAVSPLRDIPPPLTHRVYLPVIASGIPDPVASCFGNPKAAALYHLLRDDPRQQRTEMICNQALVKAAQARAEGLANGDPWSHCDGNGKCANQYVIEAGCVLPSHYGLKNNVESLAAGTQDAAFALWSLTNDLAAAHRRHVLAETEFFREQTQIGIGFAQGSAQYQYYWSILTAPECR